ncbi:acyltransferase [Pseudomonas sp. KK4]|uniref:acyltransferase family protein n=1 Tax=Pseudomonas sp. KK4 TaxID=1855729 RepID=UPI0009FAF68B|nr:acyltransferase [Pseudomonas sp. KK4]
MISKNTAYLSRLDHLRFFAALLVAAYHFHGGPALVASLNPLTVFVKEGETGVSLFMVLSGFILTVIASGKELDYKKFVYNRFIRIYPLYLTMIFLAAYASNRTVDFLQFLQLISPVANVGHFMGSTKFPHLWTIAVEFQFYLIFPFFVGFLAKYGARYIFGVVLLALSVRTMLFIRDTTVIDAAYSTIVGRIDQFCVGMMMALIFRTRSRLFSSPIALIISLVGAYLWFVFFSKITLGGYYGEASAYNPIWIISPTIEALVWAGVALAYLQQKWQMPRFLDTSLCYLGGISFSMYAWHFPIVQLFGRLTPELSVSWYWSFLFVVLPAIIAVSSLSYYIIEKPFFSLRTSYVKKPSQSLNGLFVENNSLEVSKQESAQN